MWAICRFISCSFGRKSFSNNGTDVPKRCYFKDTDHSTIRDDADRNQDKEKGEVGEVVREVVINWQDEQAHEPWTGGDAGDIVYDILEVEVS